MYAKRLVRFYSAVFFLQLTCVLAARGAEYYVDNSGGSGCSDDPAHGSESNPWCTISYALDQMVGGDDLYVKSGTYTGTFTVSGLSGTEANRTTIQAYPGHNVTLRGVGDTGRYKISGSDYVTFDGFEVTNVQQGIFVDDSDQVTIQNCEVHFVYQEGVHVRQNSNYVTIEKCTIHDTGQGTSNAEGVYIGTGSAGPKDSSSFITVRGNTIYNTPDEAVELKAGTHDCLVEGNVIYNVSTKAGIGAIEINQATGGAQAWLSNPNHVIRNNIIHDCNTAIAQDTGSLVYNNVIYDISPGSYGIYIKNTDGDSYARLAYHNTIDLPSSQAVFIQSGVSDVKNNIGPSLPGNMVSNSAYFVSTEEGREDYHLVSGSSPIDSGVDLTEWVAIDFDGASRPEGVASDIGAYEFDGVVEPVDSVPPSPPTNLRIVE